MTTDLSPSLDVLGVHSVTSLLWYIFSDPSSGFLSLIGPIGIGKFIRQRQRQFMPSHSTLYVTGFPPGTRAKDLAHDFEEIGDLVRCDIPAAKSSAHHP